MSIKLNVGSYFENRCTHLHYSLFSKRFASSKIETKSTFNGLMQQSQNQPTVQHAAVGRRDSLPYCCAVCMIAERKYNTIAMSPIALACLFPNDLDFNSLVRVFFLF